MQVELKNLEGDIASIELELTNKITSSRLHELLLKVHELSSLIGAVPSSNLPDLIKQQVNDLKERVSKVYSEHLTKQKEERIPKVYSAQKQVEETLPVPSKSSAVPDEFVKLRHRLENLSRSKLLTSAPFPVRICYMQFIGQISLHLPNLLAPGRWATQLEEFDFKDKKALEQLKSMKEEFEKEIQV